MCHELNGGRHFFFLRGHPTHTTSAGVKNKFIQKQTFKESIAVTLYFNLLHSFHTK